MHVKGTQAMVRISNLSLDVCVVSAELTFKLEVCQFAKPMILTTVNSCFLVIKWSEKTLVLMLQKEELEELGLWSPTKGAARSLINLK